MWSLQQSAKQASKHQPQLETKNRAKENASNTDLLAFSFFRSIYNSSTAARLKNGFLTVSDGITVKNKAQASFC
jgi:hypothetical protein